MMCNLCMFWHFPVKSQRIFQIKCMNNEENRWCWLHVWQCWDIVYVLRVEFQFTHTHTHPYSMQKVYAVQNTEIFLNFPNEQMYRLEFWQILFFWWREQGRFTINTNKKQCNRGIAEIQFRGNGRMGMQWLGGEKDSASMCA